MGRMSELAAEREQQEPKPEQKTVRCFFTVYTVDGRKFESIVEEMDEATHKQWKNIFQNLSRLNHLSLPVEDALNRTASIHFMPDKIVAILVTEV